MSYHTPFVVSLKAYDADESRKTSSLSRSKEKRLPPLPSPSSPKSLQPANVPSPPQDSSITRWAHVSSPFFTTLLTQDLIHRRFLSLVRLADVCSPSRTSSSGHPPILSTKVMPPKNTDHHHSFAAASQQKCTAARRIIRKQLGGGVTDSTIPQQRSQYPDPDPTSQRPEPTTMTTESSRDTEEPPSATAAGDSEDDEATLVSSSDAHACKDSRDGKVSFKDTGPNHVRISPFFNSIRYRSGTLLGYTVYYLLRRRNIVF